MYKYIQGVRKTERRDGSHFARERECGELKSYSIETLVLYILYSLYGTQE
jgi:hypothetical protein